MQMSRSMTMRIFCAFRRALSPLFLCFLLFSEPVCFLMRGGSGIDLDGKRDVEEIAGEKRGETVIRINYGGKSYFNNSK